MLYYLSKIVQIVFNAEFCINCPLINFEFNNLGIISYTVNMAQVSVH